MHKTKAITSSCSSNRCSNYFKWSEKPRGTGEAPQKLDEWYTDPTSRLRNKGKKQRELNPKAEISSRSF